MVRLENVTYIYSDGPALFHGLEWHAERGVPWSVVGASGAGKTTLLYLLSGLIEPTTGRVVVDGAPLFRPRPRTGLILQQLGLMPWSTVAGNAYLGLRIRRFYGPDGVHAPAGQRPTREAARRSVDHWLDRLGLTEYRDRYPSQLSGGQRQRVAIARTMALEPDLLLMDEPFGALDAPRRRSLQDLLVELEHEAPHTRIVVTHDIDEAVFLGRRIMVLGAGGAMVDLLDNPGGATAGYRETQPFRSMCERVRQLVEADG